MCYLFLGYPCVIPTFHSFSHKDDYQNILLANNFFMASHTCSYHYGVYRYLLRSVHYKHYLCCEGVHDTLLYSILFFFLSVSFATSKVVDPQNYTTIFTETKLENTEKKISTAYILNTGRPMYKTLKRAIQPL